MRISFFVFVLYSVSVFGNCEEIKEVLKTKFFLEDKNVKKIISTLEKTKSPEEVEAYLKILRGLDARPSGLLTDFLRKNLPTLSFQNSKTFLINLAKLDVKSFLFNPKTIKSHLEREYVLKEVRINLLLWKTYKYVKSLISPSTYIQKMVQYFKNSDLKNIEFQVNKFIADPNQIVLYKKFQEQGFDLSRDHIGFNGYLDRLRREYKYANGISKMWRKRHLHQVEIALTFLNQKNKVNHEDIQKIKNDLDVRGFGRLAQFLSPNNLFIFAAAFLLYDHSDEVIQQGNRIGYFMDWMSGRSGTELPDLLQIPKEPHDIPEKVDLKKIFEGEDTPF